MIYHTRLPHWKDLKRSENGYKMRAWFGLTATSKSIHPGQITSSSHRRLAEILTGIKIRKGYMYKCGDDAMEKQIFLHFLNFFLKNT